MAIPKIKVEVIGDAPITKSVIDLKEEDKNEVDTEIDNIFNDVIFKCKNLLRRSKNSCNVNIVKNTIVEHGINALQFDLYSYYSSHKFDYSKYLKSIEEYARDQLKLFADMLFCGKSKDAVDLIYGNITLYVLSTIPSKSQHWLINYNQFLSFLEKAYNIN